MFFFTRVLQIKYFRPVQPLLLLVYPLTPQYYLLKFMKYLFSALFFLGLILPAQAQLSYGVKAGLNVTKISFSNDDFKTSFQPGFHLGGLVNYAFNNRFSVQGEVFYSAEGGKEKHISSGNKGNINMGYIQVPVLARIVFAERFFGLAGPQIGILLSAKEKYGAGQKQDIKEYYKTADIRFPIGIGYELPGSVVSGLSLDLRYNFSFSAINKTSVGGATLKHQVISLGAQYKFVK